LSLASACVGDSSTVGGGSLDGGADATGTGTNDAASIDSSSAPTDSGGTDAGVADAGPPTCSLSQPFATPFVVKSVESPPGVSGPSGVRLGTDLLEAYYVIGGDIYTAGRTAFVGDTFTNPTEMTSLHVAGKQNNLPTVTPDGLAIYFASNRNSTNFQIYFATRQKVTDDFTNVMPVTGLANATANVGAPFVQGDGSYLYFNADYTATDAGDAGTPAGLGGFDIYRVALSGTPGQVGAIEHVVELSTPDTDGPIGVTKDGLTAYFSRYETADGSVNHSKIWTAVRGSTSAQFGTPSPVVELNGPVGANDDLSFISPDGCTAILNSYRTGTSLVYMSSRGK
jgi:hypothetical protein